MSNSASSRRISLGTDSILFYIRERLDDATFKLFDERLRQVPGVIAPWLPPKRAHLLFIYFNTEKVSGLSLLGSVRRLGLDAKIIG